MRDGLSRVTPDVTLTAIQDIRHGHVIDLTRVISGQLPRHDAIRAPQRYLTSGLPVEEQGTTVVHDYLLASTHLGTHIDALGHVGSDGTFFGGRGPEELTMGGLRTLGADRYSAVVTRGAVLDLTLPELTPPVSVSAVKAWEATIGGIRQGDCILIHGAQAVDDHVDKLLEVPAAIWLAEAGVAAIGCDGLAIESGEALDLHVTLLKNHGVPLIEGLDLAELVRTGSRSCALFIGLIRARGATAAWASVAAVL